MSTIFSLNFDTFAGTGFGPAPAAGQLDSDIFRVVGFSDSIAYGGSANSGDLARGFAGADAVTEGVYASTNGADRALIVQPDTDEFVNGGYIEAKIQNTSGSAASQFDVAFHWVHRNNQAGANWSNGSGRWFRTSRCFTRRATRETSCSAGENWTKASAC